MKALGIMSGTSLDGIDVVLADISGSFTETKIKELAFKTYPLKLKEKLSNLMKGKIDIKALTEVNFLLARAYSDAVKDLLKENNLKSENISFIASHGQTIYHSPKTHSTLQIGCGSVLATLTNITVVSNFRNADMAVGGEGAPLVPYMDYSLFTSKEEDRVLLNIGGISNITYLKKGGSLDDVVAFDTGPGNMMIDYMMEHFYNIPYDESGKHAKKGKLIPELYKELINMPYLKMTYPKSTGRELFGKSLCEEILKKYNNALDILNTLTHFTKESIVLGIKQITNNDVRIIASGGGVHNTYLMDLLKEVYPKTTTTQEYGINPDSKEALAFIMLGNETLKGKPSNVKSATGASKYVILGQISKGGSII